jgi:hypothetical protein
LPPVRISALDSFRPAAKDEGMEELTLSRIADLSDDIVVRALNLIGPEQAQLVVYWAELVGPVADPRSAAKILMLRDAGRLATCAGVPRVRPRFRPMFRARFALLRALRQTRDGDIRQ